MPRVRIFAFLIALSLTSPALAGSLYLTGHDILDHDGQVGYWLVIIDYLRGDGTPAEIPVLSYDIAVLCSDPGECNGDPDPDDKDMLYPKEMVIPAPWAGPETRYDPAALTDIGWAAVFSHDLIIVAESAKLDRAGKDALNARSAELEAYFNAGGDLWMNSSNGTLDYYTVLPPSVLSTGAPLPDGVTTGFTATAAGLAIGIIDTGDLDPDPDEVANMANGHETHNTFSSVAPGLTVFELYDSDDGDEIMSVGARDVTIDQLAQTGETIAIPTLSEWAPLLLVFLIVGLAYPALRAKHFHNG